MPRVEENYYNPKVSIVLPTYKRQHVILRTLQTIIDQDYKNWEMFIINNEKGGVLPNLPPDPRIEVHEHCEEANACYARNVGLQYVTGDLVCFFDDDDDMLPGYLKKMSAPFCDPKVMVVKCGMFSYGSKDFSYSTQEAWLRKEYATPTWKKGFLTHDQVYYREIILKNGWKKENIIQLDEILVTAHSELQGGLRESVNGY
jgi:glycosyltransferase involved in cell wall biosynthesis